MAASPKRQRASAQSAASADVSLIFDGGSIGNPGKGYGTYVTTGLVGSPDRVRIDFDGRTTSNEAEYMTLIHGLRRILQELERNARDPHDVSLAVLSDSMLVVEQLNGRWKVRHPGLRPLHAEAAELLTRFRSTTVSWHSRLHSVRVLGH
ncbi:MAG TPA: ribonuclease HI family protein [Thermomicrobiales bacterium]|nr:ribonuclease HI family protein [Thermomicrobiales bacterium]